MPKKHNLTWQTAPDLLTPPEAAAVVGLHKNSIDRALRAGKIPYHQAGRFRKIRKEDLAAYAGYTLAANGDAAPTADVLTRYAGELEAAQQLPAGPRRTAVADVIARMRNHK